MAASVNPAQWGGYFRSSTAGELRPSTLCDHLLVMNCEEMEMQRRVALPLIIPLVRIVSIVFSLERARRVHWSKKYYGSTEG